MTDFLFFFVLLQNMLLWGHFLDVICRFSRLADEVKIVQLCWLGKTYLTFWEMQPEESAVLTFVGGHLKPQG